MKLLTKLFCVVALTLPVFANAAEATITNSTMRPMKYHIGSMDFEYALPSYQVKKIQENVFSYACHQTPNKCVVTIIDADPKIRTPIAEITFNSHDGVIDIHKFPTTMINVLADRFDVVLK